MKRMGFLMVLLSIITSIFLYSCSSSIMLTNRYKADLEVAEDPPGLSVDPEHCAYIGGPIRAIDNFDFDPGKGAMQSYLGRTLRVPTGVKMVALVHYNYNANNINYFGFKRISLPPLGNEGVYVLFIDPYVGFTMWNEKQAVLRKLNIDTGEYETIPGATFVK